MMMRFLLALLVLLPTFAHAATGWVEGGESQTLAVACTGGSASDVNIGTTSPRSGSARINVTGNTGLTQGRCTMAAAGLNLTGTVYIFGAIYFDSTTTCDNNFGAVTMLDLGEVEMEHLCTNGTNAHAVQLKESGNAIGTASDFLSEDTWYPFLITITTGGTGNATGQFQISYNGSSWTNEGTTPSLTIANVDMAEWKYPRTTGVNTNFTFALDDFVMVTGGSEPPVTTYVNQRAAKAGTETYNTFTKVGGDSTNIETIWTSRVNPSTTFPGSQYARSASTASLTQTALIAAWDSGTPTPTASSTSTFHGCKWDMYAARGGGTSRTPYQTRRRTQNGSDTMVDTDTTITTTASTYTVFTSIFDILGTTSAAKLTGLNAMELGAYKSNSSTGAELHVLDQWVQCAWSAAATTTAVQWVVDDE